MQKFVGLKVLYYFYYMLHVNPNTKLPARTIHVTDEGIESPGTLTAVHPNEYPKENRWYCMFQPDEGPSLQVFLDELRQEAVLPESPAG